MLRRPSDAIVRLVAVSLVMLTGWGGVVSLGQVAIMGAGAVVTANLIADHNLDLFTSLSIIRPTYLHSSLTPTYVLLPDGHHHHIICTNCNRVIEFEECSLAGMAAVLEKRLGVRLSGHLLEFYGLCDKCV